MGTNNPKPPVTKERAKEAARETMYFASKKNSLGTYKQRIEHDYVTPTLDEFKSAMINKSPVFIFNTQYSTKQHFWEITELMKNDTVVGFCTAWADKTPHIMTWQEFYNQLKNGMEFIRF